MKVKTGLLLIDAGPWRVKARVTYLAEQAQAVEFFAGVCLQGQWDRIVHQHQAQKGEAAQPPLPMPSGDGLDT